MPPPYGWVSAQPISLLGRGYRRERAPSVQQNFHLHVKQGIGLVDKSCKVSMSEGPSPPVRLDSYSSTKS
jgi:hypothetical protein